MPGRTACGNCGGVLDVPAGYSRAKMRCPGCGYYAEVPPDLRSAPGEEPEPAPPPPAPQRRSSAPAPPPPDEPARPVKRPASAAPAPPPPDDPRWPGRPPAPARQSAAAPPPDRPPPDDDDESTPYNFSDAPVAKPPRPGEAKPVGKPVMPKAKPNAAQAPLLDGTQTDDDDRPYGVPADGTKKCPECRGTLPYDATFCVKCGTDLATGRKPVKEFQTYNRTWESRWTFQQRMIAFLSFQGLNAVILVGLILLGHAAGGFALVFFQSLLQAFVLGSYQTLNVRRTAKNATTITRTWRVAFLPMPPAKMPWETSQGLGIVATHEISPVDFLAMLYLFLFTGVCPAFVFYWFVLRPDRFQVALCDVYGSTDELIFMTTKREDAEEICRVAADCTGLTYKKVI